MGATLDFCLHPLHSFEPSYRIPHKAKNEERCGGMPCIYSERLCVYSKIFDLMELMTRFPLNAMRLRLLS